MYKIEIVYGEVAADPQDKTIQTYWVEQSELMVVLRHLRAVNNGDPMFREQPEVVSYPDLGM